MDTSLSVAPWKLLHEHVKSAGYRRVVSRRYLLPSGQEIDWGVVESPDGVAIVGLTEEDNVILVRQFRPGPAKVLLELPGGYIDPHESVEVAAARELIEETGFEAASIEIVGRTWLDASSTQERYVAIARGCKRVGLPKLDAEEFIEPITISIPEFVEHVLSGDLTDADGALRALVALNILNPAYPTDQAQ